MKKTVIAKTALIMIASLLEISKGHKFEWKDMRNYKYDWRYLTCHECFQSNGYFCQPNDMQGHVSIPYTKMKHHSVCCKPGSTHNHCQTNSYQTCSSPSIQSPGSSAILSPGGRNHQLFAYCIGTNQRMCGIGSNLGTNMDVEARYKPRTIIAKDLRFIENESNKRESDSCYYEITANLDEVEERMKSYSDKDKKHLITTIELTLRTNLNMNVYIYGGGTRETANQSIIEDNLPLEVGVTYSIEYSKGMLLVAYPNKEEENTDFKFTYGLHTIYVPPNLVVDPVPSNPVVEPLPPNPVVDPVPLNPVVDPVLPNPVVDPAPPQPVIEPETPNPVIDPVPPNRLVEPVLSNPIADPVNHIPQTNQLEAIPDQIDVQNNNHSYLIGVVVLLMLIIALGSYYYKKRSQQKIDMSQNERIKKVEQVQMGTVDKQNATVETERDMDDIFDHDDHKEFNKPRSKTVTPYSSIPQNSSRKIQQNSKYIDDSEEKNEEVLDEENYDTKKNEVFSEGKVVISIYPQVDVSVPDTNPFNANKEVDENDNLEQRKKSNSSNVTKNIDDVVQSQEQL